MIKAEQTENIARKTIKLNILILTNNEWNWKVSWSVNIKDISVN